MTAQYSVILTHPGKQGQIVYQTAVALQEIGALKYFLASVYYQPAQFPYRQLDAFSAPWARRIAERIRLRRMQPGLESRRVVSMPYPELAAVAASRLVPLRDLLGADNFILWKNASFDAWASRRIRRERFQFVHCLHGCAWRTFVAAKRMGVVRILDVSGNPLNPSYIGPDSGLGSLAISKRLQAELALADYVFSPSDFISDDIARLGFPAERIVQIPYGVDVGHFEPQRATKPGAFQMLFVGNLSLRKGVAYLLEAVKGLALPGARLTVVGNPVDRVTAELLERYRGFFDWIPHVSHGEVQALFQRSDVFVFPSLAEGSALVTYEAMACGLPSIVTKNCGSVVRDGIEGFIIPARDVAAIRNRIQTLYEDRERARAMGAAARLRAEQYTWAHYRLRVAEAYERIAKASGFQ